MSNEKEPVKDAVARPITTAQLALTAISFIERFGLAIIVTMLQWSRIKQKKAEDRLAYIGTKGKVDENNKQLDKKNEGKSDRDVILDFVNDKSGDGG